MINQCNEEKYLENIEKSKILPNNLSSLNMLEFDDSCDISLDDHKKVAKQIKRDTQVIFYYKIGLGNAFKGFRKWLKKDLKRKLVFIEDSRTSLSNFFKTTIAEEIIAHKQIDILFLGGEDATQTGFLIKKCVWENVLLKAEVFSHPLYLEKRYNAFIGIKEILLSEIYGAGLIVGNYSDFGMRHLENTFKNLFSSKEFILAKELKDSMKNIPAVVCGAGPSILKNMETLKDIRDKAIFFAGGASVNILNNNNISSDFAVNIDMKAPQERFEDIKHLDVPHFVQLQMSHENFSSLSAKKILLPPYGSYPLEEYIYENLKIDQDLFEIGWTVGSAQVAIAAYMGCNPIIFTGLDFCYNQNESKYPENSNIKEGEQIELVDAVDEDGKKVVTQKDWLLAKQWIEEFARDNPNVSFINANEGGLAFTGIKSKGLKEILDNGFFKQQDMKIKTLIADKIEEASLTQIDRGNVQGVCDDIKKSAMRCLNICDQMTANMKDIFASKNYSFKEFEEEIFFTKHLQPLWNIFSYVINRDIVDQKQTIDIDLAYFMNRMIFYKNICEKYIEMTSQVLG